MVALDATVALEEVTAELAMIALDEMVALELKIALEEIRALEEIVADGLLISNQDDPLYPRHLELAEL